jgi:NAD(P)H dehydrogenase (quinone)
MRVLVVYAHYNPESFTHALLEHVTKGLADGGHDYEVVDLYAIGFDPVFGLRDAAQFVHDTVPEDLLKEADLRELVVKGAGSTVRRYLAKRWLRGKSRQDIIELISRQQPSVVRAQQAKVARAEGLVFVTPILWMGLPAILKGWLERVFAYGFAYTLTPEGWKGNLDGRVPLLTQRKGLLVSPTFFTKEEYDRGWRDAMDTILCEWGLKMAGVQEAEHVLFYAVIGADDATRQEYLARAYALGKEF